eukprot:TRINITY_DN473_c0_g2_i2.p1 TRINITY_DN473_c0_g2~~TRINITY_DN473_c0_g2_i2.p1  ORF type:complete len:326 (+),score=109.48 TRINITY_DN473_c0_g2_i2:85-1062(+)
MKNFIINLLLIILIFYLNSVENVYYLERNLNASNNFFDSFNFYNGPDPTHGYVYYTSRQEAFDWGYVSYTNNKVRIGCDSWSVSVGSGRGSVRIESYESFDNGLFIFDLDHMPSGCGTWPAYWLCGPNWPNNGEIDVIEGVSDQNRDQTTLHTNDGCSMSSVSSNSFTGQWATGSNGQPATNCYVNAPNQYSNQGCGVFASSNTFGSAFNNNGGGVYATEWTSSFIRVWFWRHDSVPYDVRNGSPNPSSWGTPYAYFQLGSNCPSSHFKSQQIIINLTFCGDWAGSTFGQDCPGLGNCNDYVKNNPSAFKNAYWLINNLAIYKNH